MTATRLRASAIVASLLLAGCNASLEDIAPKSERQLPEKLVTAMKAKGMTRSSPIMLRIFKEEGVLEVWKRKDTGRFDLVTTYEICKWSGKLGPKFKEGDRQAPEGFYTVAPWQMNPKSQYHLSFNIGFPNAYDRVHGRTGQHLMVHGACSSSGCYSMTDEQVQEIYAFARDAFRGGQTEFQLQAFPFRMTAANMARYKNDPNADFWQMLKEGYDHFEITKLPPKVDVCEKRYVFNRMTEPDAKFTPAGACPPSTQPETLQTAYQSYQASFMNAYSSAVAENVIKSPMPSIAGLKEANLVSEWSRRRARGERVSLEPPSLAPDGRVIENTTRTGRIDSPEGRRKAEAEAAEAAKKKAAEAAEAAELAEVEAARKAAAETAAPEAEPAAPPAAVEAQPEKRRGLWKIFGS
jgi:murein L,D-transpeptidase YafK